MILTAPTILCLCLPLSGPSRPGPSGPQEPTRVALSTTAGDTFTGELALEQIELRTDWGSAAVRLEQLDSIVFGPPDLVLTRGGQDLRGTLALKRIELALEQGPRTWRRSELVSLEVLIEGERPALEGFQGRWMTSFGPLTLERRGRTFSGRYGWQEESSVEGRLVGKRLELEWLNANQGRGTAELALWPAAPGERDVFTGTSRYPGGEEFWGGYRLEPERAAIRPGQVSRGQSESGLNYHLRVPRDYAPDAPRRYTAIALFHGSNMSARAYVDTFAAAWPALAEQYLLVGFDGEHLAPGAREGEPIYNASYVGFIGENAGEPWRYNQTPGLVARALQQLSAELPIERWFVGGHSQGGFLTYAVALFFPRLVAGAFPVSGNLLVQCAPGRLGEDLLGAARRVPFALVHGRNDEVIEFSAATDCERALQDGGFPALRLFSDPEAGHRFALLPVDRAVQWLEAISAREPERLLEFAAQSLEQEHPRDASAALLRLQEVDSEGRLAPRAKDLIERIDRAGAAQAEQLFRAISTNRDATWVEAFWDFRARFGLAPCARGVLQAYQGLRDLHEGPADELFWRARGEGDEARRRALYAELVERYYASSYYPLVRGWIEGG